MKNENSSADQNKQKKSKQKKVVDSDLNPLFDFSEKIEVLENQVLELEEKLKNSESAQLRAIADLQNAQRREMENKLQWSALSIKDFVKKLLPHFVAFESGAKHTSDKDLAKIVGNFFQALEKQGLNKIEPKTGETINPDLHEVLLAAEGTPGTVVQMLEAGWQYQSLVITPAKISATPEN